MVFVVSGGRLRISGLTISLNEDGSLSTSNPKVEMGFDLWPYWLDIAADHAETALSHASDLGRLSGQEMPQAALLADECRAGMVSIAASAFALDSFYDAVSSQRDMGGFNRKWAAARTPRHSRITELLHQTFAVGNPEGKDLARMIREIFTLRDRAVHPSGEFEAPVRHPLITPAVPWPYLAFNAANARQALLNVAGVMYYCMKHPRRTFPAIVTWSEGAAAEAEPRFARLRVMKDT
jgi:hypothetical protein